MFTRAIGVICCSVMMPLFSSLAADEIRLWTSTVGSQEKAKLVRTLPEGAEPQIAVLQRESGVEIKVPLNRLIADDQKFVRAHVAATRAAAQRMAVELPQKSWGILPLNTAKVLVSGEFEGSFAVVDTATKKYGTVRLGGGYYVRCLVYSPDRKQFLAAGDNGRIHAFSWPALKVAGVMRLTDGQDRAISYITRIAFSPDGKMIAICYGKGQFQIRHWPNMKPHSEYTVFGLGPISTAAYSPDSRFIAVGGIGNSVVIYDLNTKKQVKELATPNCQQLLYSPDGGRLFGVTGLYAAGGRLFGVAESEPGGKLTVWDMTEEDKHKTVATHTDVYCLALSPDGKKLAVGGYECISIINPANFELISTWDEHKGRVLAVKFSEDGKTVYSVGDDRFVAWKNLAP